MEPHEGLIDASCTGTLTLVAALWLPIHHTNCMAYLHAAIAAVHTLAQAACLLQLTLLGVTGCPPPAPDSRLL